jgi:hypothetical protein
MGAWGSQIQISPAVSWGLYISRCRLGALTLVGEVALPVERMLDDGVERMLDDGVERMLDDGVEIVELRRPRA